MPEGYTHIRTAQRAAEAVRYKVKCPAAFAAGANGPDTLFCYQAWKPARKRLYDLPALGSRLHEENTGAFLCSMVSHVRTVAQVEYVMGFLSHYAADTVIHPYVAALCRPGMPYAKKGGHGCFEAALDTLLHEQDTGSGMVPAADIAPVLGGEALADIANLLHVCLREVYALDVPVEYLADSFYHTHKLRGLFTSRWSVRRAFYWLVEPLFAGRGYITGHVTPRKMKPGLPDTWCDPCSGEEREGDIFALLDQARSRSEKFMAAAILTWGGQLRMPDLAAQLGSMSYSEGRSTARSDPAYVPPQPETPEPETKGSGAKPAGAETENEPDTPLQERPADAAESAGSQETKTGAGDAPREASATPGPGPAGKSSPGAQPGPVPVPEDAPAAAEEADGSAAPPAGDTPAGTAEPEPPPVTVLVLPKEMAPEPGPADETEHGEAPQEAPETVPQQEGDTL